MFLKHRPAVEITCLLGLATALACNQAPDAGLADTDDSGSTSGDDEPSPPDLGPAPAQLCGNGILDEGEQCDDGDVLGCDACVKCAHAPFAWSVDMGEQLMGLTANEFGPAVLAQHGESGTQLIALHPDGTPRFEQPVELDPNAWPALHAMGDAVVIVDTQVRAFDEVGLRWSLELPSEFAFAVAYAEGIATLSTDGDENLVAEFHHSDDGSSLGSALVGQQVAPDQALGATGWGEGLLVTYDPEAVSPYMLAYVRPAGDEPWVAELASAPFQVGTGPLGTIAVAEFVSLLDTQIQFSRFEGPTLVDTVPSVSPIIFGANCHAVGTDEEGGVLAVTAAYPDLDGEPSAHLEREGEELLGPASFRRESPDPSPERGLCFPGSTAITDGAVYFLAEGETMWIPTRISRVNLDE